MTPVRKYFYPSQRAWIQDHSRLKLCVKSRQTGFSYANAFRLVLILSAADAQP
jgi:phage FluMu gp28-like protein